MHRDLLLTGGHVVTLDAALPSAGAVAVRDGQIIAVGAESTVRTTVSPQAQVIDCRGRVVLPGFIDAHIHLTAYAAALRAVDCSPASTGSIADIQRLLAQRADTIPSGQWVRASGYDETALAEDRHPTRWDLDAAVPDHPVRLLHRTGHALVLNSRALAAAGITTESEEPPGGVIDRRWSDGEPTGLLLDMNESVARVVPPLSRAELVAGMRAVSERLLAAGVTAVQDMSHTNDRDTPAFLAGLAKDSAFGPRMLPPAEGWRGFPDLGNDASRPVKLLVRENGDRPIPDTDEMTHIIEWCAGRGRQLAIHAVARRTVVSVVEAFARVRERARTRALRHRIEHAGVCSTALAERIAALGLVVVSNPGFLDAGGERYLRRVAEEDLPWLYPLGTLHSAGVQLAAGSDAPVAPPTPLRALRAAVSRRSSGGRTIPGIGLPEPAALGLFGGGAAFAVRAEAGIGTITPGKRADLVVMTGNPLAEDTSVAMTIVGGAVRWAAGD
jgi:predicted amidohydrolase YtcJ